MNDFAREENNPSRQEINTLVALFNNGRYAEAATLARAMTMRFPLHGFGWKALGAVLKQMGRSADSLVPMQKAAALMPNDADVYCNLGHTLMDMGRLNEAVVSYRRALEINPNFAEAHNGLGTALKDLGQLDDAVARYRRALEIKPNFAEAHGNLGVTLHMLNRLAEAEVSHRKVLEIRPDYVEAHSSLGNTLKSLGRLDEAEASYKRALEIKPDYVDALSNLALVFIAQGKSTMSLNAIKQSLQIKETIEAKNIFVYCIKHLRFIQDDSVIRALMVRALTEPWVRSSELASACVDLIKLNRQIDECISRATSAWPRMLTAQELFDSSGLAAVSSDRLLRALLNSTPICDIELERFMTMCRWALLNAACGEISADAGAENENILSFYSALVCQCFINEYVYPHNEDEIKKAGSLRDSLSAALEAGTQVPALWLVAVAAYFPLRSLPLAPRLLDTQWPEAVAAVLAQQVREPEEERQICATIPRLTGIEDAVSLLVQGQYEENPYPRWIRSAPSGKPITVVSWLRQLCPFMSFQPPEKYAEPEILIAGCGTGQHSIQTAQQFQGARVLAVDLSISSLGYAKRKTRELGLTSIEYAQADLLKLGSLGRSFDVIESVGVLHHLADPWAGWQVLLSLLRPGGFMKLGFYSEAARQDIVRIRTFIAEQGYGSSVADIRQCRQDILNLEKNADFGTTLKLGDFFSISDCRDLLFHVQEHRMNLIGIDAFLRKNNLEFLGFEIGEEVIHAYHQRFPDDRTATNLGQWHLFENENPNTFISMYQFWIRKVI